MAGEHATGAKTHRSRAVAHSAPTPRCAMDLVVPCSVIEVTWRLRLLVLLLRRAATPATPGGDLLAADAIRSATDRAGISRTGWLVVGQDDFGVRGDGLGHGVRRRSRRSHGVLATTTRHGEQ